MKLHLALASTLALAGCNSPTQKIDASLAANENNIELACSSTTLAYALFEATAAEKVKESTLTKIRAGYAGVAAVCANPPKNTTEAIGAAIRAVKAFRAEVDAATQKT